MEPAYPLAIVHHLAAFALVSALAVETAMVRPGLAAGDARRLARVDGIYGLAALVLLAAGGMRTVWGLKGWDWYAGNPVFWTKLALFVAVGLLSVRPTVRFAAWSRRAAADGSAVPAAAEIAEVRRFLMLQWLLLAAIPVLAAALGQNL